jgi:menaquinone-dependent protoporphyrinogen IX oxidase
MFVENAHHRLAQLYHAFYMILVVSQDEKEVEEAKEYKKKEIEEYKVLQEKSKRMNNMYKSILQELLKEEKEG